MAHGPPLRLHAAPHPEPLGPALGSACPLRPPSSRGRRPARATPSAAARSPRAAAPRPLRRWCASSSGTRGTSPRARPAAGTSLAMARSWRTGWAMALACEPTGTSTCCPTWRRATGRCQGVGQQRLPTAQRTSHRLACLSACTLSAHLLYRSSHETGRCTIGPRLPAWPLAPTFQVAYIQCKLIARPPPDPVVAPQRPPALLHSAVPCCLDSGHCFDDRINQAASHQEF